MPTKKIRDLRHEYKAAYTAYMTSVQVLSDAGLTGALPSIEMLSQEKHAFNEISAARKALLDALAEHDGAAQKSN